MAVVPIGGLAPVIPPLHDSDSTFLSQVPNGGGVYDPLLRVTLQQLDLYVKSKGSSNTPIILSGTAAGVTVNAGDQTLFINKNATDTLHITLYSGQNPGDLLLIKDIAGTASPAHPITIVPNPPATIDGLTTVNLQIPYASMYLEWDGTKWGDVAEPYPWLPLNPVLVNGTATVNPDALTEAQLIYVNNTSLAAMTLTLGPGQVVGQRVTIKDIAGNASSYPITVSVAPHTIETGATSVQLTAAFQSLELIWTGNWIQIPVLPPFALPPPVVINGGITVWTPGPQAFYTIHVNNTSAAGIGIRLNPGTVVDQRVLIKDIAGNAATYVINISQQNGNPIDGTSPFIQLNENYQSVELIWTGANWGQVPPIPIPPAQVPTGSATINLPQVAYYTVFANNTSAAPITLSLGPGLCTEQRLIIKDIAGNAGTYAITISGTGGTLIDNFPTLTLNGNYAGVQLIWNGTMWGSVPGPALAAGSALVGPSGTFPFNPGQRPLILVQVDCSGGPVTINLGDGQVFGQEVVFKDTTGHAYPNTITITPSANIEGLPSAVITVPYGSATLFWQGGVWLPAPRAVPPTQINTAASSISLPPFGNAMLQVVAVANNTGTPITVTIGAGHSDGQMVVIKDVQGTMGLASSPVTIACASNIDGQASLVMPRRNYGAITLYWFSNTWNSDPLAGPDVQATTITNTTGFTLGQALRQMVYVNNGTAAPMAYTLGIGQAVGQEVVVKDIAGNAATYPITVNAAPRNIDGATSVLLDANYQSLRVIWDGTNWYEAPTIFPRLPAPFVITTGGIVSFGVGREPFWAVHVNNGSASIVTIRLNDGLTTDQRILIKDIRGNAGTWNIYVQRTGGLQIDGQTSIIITQNYGSVELFWDGSAWRQLLPKGNSHNSFSNVSAYPTTGHLGLGTTSPGQGQNATIIPGSTGRVLFNITGTFWGNTFSANVSLQYGSGTPPALNAAQTGTQIAQSYSQNTNGTPSALSLTALVTGLTLGTTYWFDLFFQAAQPGLPITNYACTAVEL